MVATWLLVIAGALVLGAIIWLARWWDAKQTQRWRRFATERGWRFTDKDEHDRPARYRAFEPFDQGHSRYARWILSGEHESAPFEIFHYHYAVTTSSGKTTTTTHHWFKVCTLEMPIAAPGLVIKDEHLGHKLFDAVGGEDIDVEHDAFSRKFWVQCEDRRFAYDILHPDMIEFLLETEGWLWEWQGEKLLLIDEGRFEPAACDELLDLVTRFRERIPRHRLAQGS